MSHQPSERPVRAGRLALLVVASLVFAACASTPATPPASAGPGSSQGPSSAPGSQPSALPSEQPSDEPSEEPSDEPSSLPSLAPTAVPATPTPSPTATTQAACANQVLRSMTKAQRIGELFALGLAKNQLGTAELSAIQNQHVGTVWFTATTTIGVAGIRAVTSAVQAQATVAATDGVELLIAANQEGGQVQALKGTGFATIPSAVVQGGRSIATLTAEAKVWGQELKSAGVNLDFAPVADVVPPGTDSTNQPIGVLQREYGHDPVTAGSHAAAFIAGLTAAGVDTTAKHFPGLGRVENNTDFSANVVDDVTTAHDPYLGSFQDAIDAHVPFVMVALATYTRIDPDNLAAFSPTVMGILRNQLGFKGVITSDSLTAKAVASIPAGQRAIDFLVAGGDLVVVNSASAMVTMVNAVQARVTTDPAFSHLVDEDALLVLKAKAAAGLLPAGC
ncbi:MAG TPA: glycoside hydrolase family 3 N-terminal domain-containing protein [Candidatus Limnocylindrales bacterium]|nr:glycoside hydrolase family 3 N-terminal domain-containing protein [Candidatus Limnocylindrales bacterium]